MSISDPSRPGPASASEKQPAAFSWQDLVCITNRHLFDGDGPAARENFLQRLEEIAKQKPRAIVLREKDLPEEDYAVLAQKVLAICREQGTLCILHNFPETAQKLAAPALHLPLAKLRSLTPRMRASFPMLGTSCHSLSDLQEAETLGCSYVFAGHIFATSCKPGLPPRGLTFLQEICRAASVPVYAIGGMTPSKLPLIRKAGAKGACAMSSMMKGGLWL